MRPTPEQAKMLLAKGMISQDQFNRLNNSNVPGYYDGTPPITPESAAQTAQNQATYQTATGAAEDAAPTVTVTPQGAIQPVIPQVIPDTPYSGVGSEFLPAHMQNISLPAASSQGLTSTPLSSSSNAAADPNLKLASDVQITRPHEGSSLINPGLPSGVGTPLSIYNAQTKQIQDIAKGGGGAAALGQANIPVINQKDQSEQALYAAQAEREAKEDQQKLDILDKLHTQASQISNAKVDTNRYWNNMDTGGKVAAGIGLFLGAFGAGPNRAVGVIDNAIKQDVDAQKADFDNLKAGYSANKGIYGDMVNLFKDRSLADLATQAQYQQHAANQIAMNQAKFAGSGEGAKLQQLADEMAVKQQETAMQFNQRAQQLSALTAASNGQNISPLLLDKDTAAKYVPGYGITYSPEDAKEMKEMVASVGSARNSLAELTKIASNPLNKLNPDAIAKAKTEAANLLGTARTVIFPGKPLGMEFETLKEIAADPTRIGSLPQKDIAMFAAVNKLFDNKLAEKSKAVGLQTPQQRSEIKPLQNATATKP